MLKYELNFFEKNFKLIDSRHILCVFRVSRYD